LEAYFIDALRDAPRFLPQTAPTVEQPDDGLTT
jgi:hypothetical protein